MRQKSLIALLLITLLLMANIPLASANPLFPVFHACVFQEDLYYITSDSKIWRMENAHASPQLFMDLKTCDQLPQQYNDLYLSYLVSYDDRLFLLYTPNGTLWEMKEGTLTETTKLDFSDLGYYPYENDPNYYNVSISRSGVIIDGWLYLVFHKLPEYTHTFLYRFSLENGQREKLEIPSDKRILGVNSYKGSTILVETRDGITYSYDPIQTTFQPIITDIKSTHQYSGVTYDSTRDKLYYFNDLYLMEYIDGMNDKPLDGGPPNGHFSVTYSGMWLDKCLVLCGQQLYLCDPIPLYSTVPDVMPER